jgi:hypothetical protein
MDIRATPFAELPLPYVLDFKLILSLHHHVDLPRQADWLQYTARLERLSSFITMPFPEDSLTSLQSALVHLLCLLVHKLIPKDVRQIAATGKRVRMVGTECFLAIS